MSHYRIEFTGERIGRNHEVEPIEIEAESADGIAEAVYRHARTKLASSHFDVVARIDTMSGTIEAGRFGSFTITEL